MIYESSSTTACYTPDRHTGELTDYELIHMPYWEIIEYRKEHAVDDYIARWGNATDSSKYNLYEALNKDITEETISYNASADIYSIEIMYEGIPRIDRGIINIDFGAKEMLFESANNVITKYDLNDSQKIINFIKDNVLRSDWDEDMIEPPSDVTVMLPIGDNVYRLLWRIKVVTSEDEYIFCNYEKYPYYWYELIDIICGETGIPRRIVGIY